MNGTSSCAAVLASLGLSSLVQAYTYEYRIVERVGEVDHVLPSTISVRPGTAHRYRLQVRVVSEGPADARAGLLAWNVGRITTTGGINTRTAAAPDPNPRGRLTPFTGAHQSTAEGSPTVDPFTSLTEIDAAVLIRTFPWECGTDGQPLPQPQPSPFGRDEFISLFEFTSVATAETYTITFAGNLIAGESYNVLVCNPPECGDPQSPGDDEPSSCDYAPRPYAPRSFTLALTLHACRGEWNNDYVINSQDIFDFFGDFFAGDADINNDGRTNSDDYFQFIIGFVSGCL